MSEETTNPAPDAAPDGTLLTDGVQAQADAQAGDKAMAQAEAKPDERSQAADGEAADKPGEDADPVKSVPEKPEGYQFEFEEGTQVDDGLLAGFKTVAHELGINQGQAQKLASFYATEVAKMNASALEARGKQLADAEEGWIKEIKAMPDFEGKKADATRAMEQFGKPELVELFNNTRLGSHPALFNFVATVGKALGEPGFVRSKDGAGERSLAERLYPNQGK